MPKNPAIRWGIILAAIIAVISGVLFFLQANASAGTANLSEINLEHYAE